MTPADVVRMLREAARAILPADLPRDITVETHNRLNRLADAFDRGEWVSAAEVEALRVKLDLTEHGARVNEHGLLTKLTAMRGMLRHQIGVFGYHDDGDDNCGVCIPTRKLLEAPE